MSKPNQTRPVRAQSGKWLVVVLFVLASVAVFAFYKTSYKMDPAPQDAVWGRPGRPVRVAVIDAGDDSSAQKLVERINTVKADFILVQHVKATLVDAVAVDTGMTQGTRPQVYYPAQNIDGPGNDSGNAIFSRFPLYEGRSTPNKGGSFGVWAATVIEGHKFMIASVALGTLPAKETDMLKKAWAELRSPPMIVGGDFAGADVPEATAASKNVVLLGGWEVDSTATTENVATCR